MTNGGTQPFGVEITKSISNGKCYIKDPNG